MTSTVRAFRLAYDGRPFSGFQRQPDMPTVEDAIFDALEGLGVADLPRERSGRRPRPPGYAAAGRTDAGVSAAAQTIAFEAPSWLTPRAFNGHLPKHVRAWAAADVPADFHATHDATRRTYRYHLYAPPAESDGDTPSTEPTAPTTRTAPTAPAVDDERVRAALDRLTGEHDVHNLTPDTDGTIRSITARATRTGDVLVLEVAADGFPREFVRRLVTLVRAVGTGDASLSRVDRVLSPDPVAGPEGVGPAPPTPLVLWDVAYEEVTDSGDGTDTDGDAVDGDDRRNTAIRFDPDPEAIDSTRTAFAEEHVTARHAAAMTAAVRRRVGSDH
ncbi:tRNA pseudouridine38-40 synthase [Halopenitus malekzadehii]|uniref:tRNA pseudouridine synthase A n=1 Tax=Halopenitus malekzadehii TaxID=1267564 RepID=A0A1H6ITS8_9EURY|nr:tRNA pseudouridine38-40 synthase [Halopenitus malekzadehii]